METKNKILNFVNWIKYITNHIFGLGVLYIWFLISKGMIIEIGIYALPLVIPSGILFYLTYYFKSEYYFKRLTI